MYQYPEEGRTGLGAGTDRAEHPSGQREGLGGSAWETRPRPHRAHRPWRETGDALLRWAPSGGQTLGGEEAWHGCLQKGLSDSRRADAEGKKTRRGGRGGGGEGPGWRLLALSLYSRVLGFF